MNGQTQTTTSLHALLRRLAEVRTEPRGVLSVYVDLDPSVFPTPKARRTAIDILVSEASDEFVVRDLPAADRHRRAEAIDRVRDVLLDPDLAKGGTRSVAVFAASSGSLAEDVFEVVHLPHPVAPAVVVDDSPYLRPLADEAGPRTWVVLLVDRQHTRLLYGGPRRLVEVESFADTLVPHTEQGGWSQARYQRHSDDAAREHIEHTVRELFEFFQRTRFDALAVAAPDPTCDELVDALHPYLRERLEGRVRIEVTFPSPGQILEAAQPLFEQARERAIGAILDTLEEASRDQVAIGPADVLAALNDRRVDTLVLEQRYAAGGVRCQKCSWIALDGDRCGFDQTPTERREDIVDDAVDVALMQAARVVSVPTDAPRHPPQPIAALLRF